MFSTSGTLIQIRCKACRKLALEVGPETTGRLRIKCRGSKCRNWIDITLPFKNVGPQGSGRAGSVFEKAVAVNP